MPPIDRVKEQIGWLKVVFGLLFATEISMIAYLFKNIEQLAFLQILLVIIALIIVALALIYTNKKAMRKINSLEDM